MDRDLERRRRPGAGADAHRPAAATPGKGTLAAALPPPAAREADYAALTAKAATSDGVLAQTVSESSTATTHAPDHRENVARVKAELETQRAEIQAALAGKGPRPSKQAAADALAGNLADRTAGRLHRRIVNNGLSQVEVDRLTGELASIEGDLATLEAGVDTQGLDKITERVRFVVGHATRKTNGTTTTDSDTLTLDSMTLKRVIAAKQVAHGKDRDVSATSTQTASVSASGVLESGERQAYVATGPDGAISSRALGKKLVVDVLGGKLTASGDREEVETDASGASEKRTQNRSIGLSAGGGKLRVGVTFGEGNEATPAGGKQPTSGGSTKTTAGVGLLGGKHGVGLGYDSADETSTIGPSGRVETKKVDRAINLSTRGVSGTIAKTGTTKGKLGELERRGSADGSFTADLVRQDDGTYLVTITLHASIGGTGKGSARKLKEGQAGFEGSLGGSVKASGEVRWTKTLSEDEAAVLLSEVEQADGTKTKYVGLLSRLHAFVVHGGDAASAVTALFSSAAGIEQLKVGETIAVDLAVEAAVNAGLPGKVGGFGVGVSGEVSAGRSRSLAIKRLDPAECNGRRCVEITVGLGATSSVEGEGALSFEGAGVGRGHKESREKSDQVTVRLYPDDKDYKTLYDRVLTASPDEVRSIAKKQYSRVAAASEDSARPFVGPVEVPITDTAHRATERTVEDGRVTVTEEGGRTAGSAFKVGDIKLGQGSTNSQARYTADRSGSTLALETEREQSDFGKAMEGIAKAIADRYKPIFGRTGPDGKRLGRDQEIEQAVSSATQSPGEVLKKELEKTYASLERYHLGPAQVQILVTRAADATKWAHCAGSPGILGWWEALREVLHDPPASDERGVDHQQALEVTRAHAIARFMEKCGSAGLQALIGVLRRWGVNRALDPREASAGVHEQWPAPIAWLRPTYEEVQADVEFAGEEFAKRAARIDKAKAMPQFYQGVKDKIAKARDAIAGCDAFRDPSARLEMLDQLDRLAVQLDEAWRKYAPLADETLARQASASSEPTTRMAQLVGLLHEYKTTEARMFERVYALLPTSHGGRNDSWFTAGSVKEARELLESPSTSQLYTNWIDRIRELRALYDRLQTPLADRHVAPTPGPDSFLEPDLAKRIELFQIANQMVSNADASSHVVRWRKQADY
jgi:hypothetical protein